MSEQEMLQRIDWLEDERRKAKHNLTALENRLTKLEGGLNAAEKQAQDVSSEVTRLSVVLARVDQFETDLSKHRVDLSKQVDELEKKHVRRAGEDKKVRDLEINGLKTDIETLRSDLGQLDALRADLKRLESEDLRIARVGEEAKAMVVSIERKDDERQRSYRLIEDSRRQDTKRVNDLAGDVAAMRKRQDEQRGRQELLSENDRKTDNRLNELIAAEAERRENQIDFMEKQAVEKVERDRTWTEWTRKFDSIQSLSDELQTQIERLEATQRAANQAKDDYDNMTDRLDRRITELTEMQRLSEDRFRQEWVTFKADDQKRWTNYTLTQEERQSDSGRRQENLIEQVAVIEDQMQELRDILDAANQQTEKRLQTLLANLRDWVTEFEQTIGSSK